MAETANRDKPEMRYLLGSLSENERTRMEEAYFADDARFDELEIAEDELIDAYLREELSDNEKQQFENQLGKSPRLVERVYFARAFAERAATLFPHERAMQPIVPGSEPAREAKISWTERLFGQQPGSRVAFAACLVLLLICSAALVAGWLHLRRESERMALERAALQRQKDDLDSQLGEQLARTNQLTTDLQLARAQVAADLKQIEDLEHPRQQEKPGSPLFGSIVSLLLSPGLPRGESNKPELKVRPDTSAAQLKIVLEKNDYPRYGVSITTVDGAVVWGPKRLRPLSTDSGAVLALAVHSHLLPPNDYIVHVDGVTASGQVESVNDYEFRVVK